MIDINKNIILAPYTTLRIGGPAKFFVDVKNGAELLEAIKWAKENNQKYFILGGGSNILFSDKRYDGLVVKLQNNEIEIKGDKITVGAGFNLSQLVNESIKAELSGLEWSAGIPGTVGGAVCGNAGAFGGSMADSVESVEVFDDDKIKILKNIDLEFGYRTSIFKKQISFSDGKNIQTSPPDRGNSKTISPDKGNSQTSSPDKGNSQKSPPDKGGWGVCGLRTCFIPYNKKLTKKAKDLRQNMTRAEKKIWHEVLRDKDLMGYKFVRQKPIDNFIVDFFCSKLMLAIEIDGASHGEKQEYDLQRTKKLESFGVQVVRYTDDEINNGFNGVYQNLVEVIEDRKSNLLKCGKKKFRSNGVDDCGKNSNPPSPPYQGGIDTPLIRGARGGIFDKKAGDIQSNKLVIISVTLKLKKGNVEESQKLIKEILISRSKQPKGFSAGSIFKNPPHDFAGRLIEECGLKGLKIGNAQISKEHGNFIINLGNAKASDVLALIERAKSEVLAKFNINLEEELTIIF